MFTGLIQSIGIVQDLQKRGREMRLQIMPRNTFAHILPGESIAVNGVCLTVEKPVAQGFSVYASAETMQRSNLGLLHKGDALNLERAIRVGDRLGGHMLNGHVDCQAWVEQIQAAGDSWVYRLGYPQEWSRYFVPKGSVALDGVSLTVNSCGSGYLEVNIIPATMKQTIIGQWRSATRVNLEVDIIAKYVLSFLAPWKETQDNAQESNPSLSINFLKEHGFF